MEIKNIVKLAMCFVLTIFSISYLLLIILEEDTDKLYCVSDSGYISISFDENLIDFNTDIYVFDMDLDSRYIEKIGIDKYIEEFSAAFNENYEGYCQVHHIN